MSKKCCKKILTYKININDIENINKILTNRQIETSVNNVIISYTNLSKLQINNVYYSI